MRTVPTPQEWREEQQARSEVRRCEIWIPDVLTPIVPELVCGGRVVPYRIGGIHVDGIDRGGSIGG